VGGLWRQRGGWQTSSGSIREMKKKGGGPLDGVWAVPIKIQDKVLVSVHHSP
jgi:hypothetical protein